VSEVLCFCFCFCFAFCEQHIGINLCSCGTPLWCVRCSHKQEMQLLREEMTKERERQLRLCRRKCLEERRRVDKANANTLKKLRLSYSSQIGALKQMLQEESERLAAAREEVVKLTRARYVGWLVGWLVGCTAW